MPKTTTPAPDLAALTAAKDKATVAYSAAKEAYREACDALAAGEAYEAARAKVADMPDAEREALAQAIGAHAVETGEKVGSPAGKGA